MGCPPRSRPRAPASARARTLTLALAAAAVFTSSSFTACMREGAPPIAPVEVAVSALPEGGAGPELTTAAPPGLARDRCSARLRPGPIATGTGCTLDERLSSGPGVLLYPCAGDGVVEAVFGEHHFEGTVSNGVLAVDLTTEIDWDDGCHWQTRQRIRGDWRPEAKHKRLAWSYSEGPVSGAGCFGSCKASSEIELEESAPASVPASAPAPAP